MNQVQSAAGPVGSGEDRLDTVLAFLIGSIPYVFVLRLPPNPGFWGQWAAAVLVLAWVATRTRLAPASLSAAAPWFALALLLIVQAGVGIAALPLGAGTAAALLAVAGMAAASASVDAGSERWRRFVESFAFGLIAALGLNAAVVVINRLGYEVHPFGLYATPALPRANGLIGQSNHLGMLAVFAFFSAVHLHGRQRLSRAAMWLVGLVAAAVCAATVSRIALVVWLMLFALTIAWQRDCNPQRAPTRRQLMLLGLMFIVVQAATAAFDASRAGQAQQSMTRTADAGRVAMLRDAVQLWQQSPILGVGHGNYAARRLHDLAGPVPALNADNAHNLIAQALAEWGLIGAAIALAASVYFLWLVWHRLRERDRSADELFASSWVVGLLAHSMVEHPLWSTHLLLPFAIFSGALLRRSVLRNPTPPRGLRAAGALLMVLAIGATIAWDYWRGQRIALGILAELELPPGSPALIRFADVAAVDRLTLFPTTTKILLSRKLPNDDQAVLAKVEIARQAMDAIPNGETIARWAAFNAMAGRSTEAQALLDALFARNSGQYAETIRLLKAWAPLDPRVATLFAALRAPPV